MILSSASAPISSPGCEGANLRFCCRFSRWSFFWPTVLPWNTLYLPKNCCSSAAFSVMPLLIRSFTVFRNSGYARIASKSCVCVRSLTSVKPLARSTLACSPIARPAACTSRHSDVPSLYRRMKWEGTRRLERYEIPRTSCE